MESLSATQGNCKQGNGCHSEKGHGEEFLRIKRRLSGGKGRMSKNRHGGKKRQKQRRHFRRQVDIAYIWQQQQRGEGGIAICHIALCTAHICVHPSHLRRLRAQVKHVMIAVLSSRSLNNLLPSSPWVRGPLTKQCLLLLYDR